MAVNINFIKYKETKYPIEPNISYIRLIWINITRTKNIIKIPYVVAKRYIMVIKYAVRGYMLRLTSYTLRVTQYVPCGYVLQVKR